MNISDPPIKYDLVYLTTTSSAYSPGDRHGAGGGGEGGSVLELLERPSSHAHIWSWLNWRLRGLVRSPPLSPVLKRDEKTRVQNVFLWFPCVVSAERREQLSLSELSRADFLFLTVTQALASVRHTHIHHYCEVTV